MYPSNTSHPQDCELYSTPDIDKAAFLAYSGIPLVGATPVSPKRVEFFFPRDAHLDSLVVDYQNSSATVHVELHQYVDAKQTIMRRRNAAIESFNARGGAR